MSIIRICAVTGIRHPNEGWPPTLRYEPASQASLSPPSQPIQVRRYKVEGLRWLVGVGCVSMQASRRARVPADIGDGASASCDANFYALPFVSQMVVWAIRRRLVEILHDSPESVDVLSVFHMAGWGDLYSALLDIVQILLSSAQDRLIVHAPGCPSISRQEAYLLNALAHLHNERADECALCLCELLAPSSARLALPRLRIIAEKTRAQDLRFVYVDLSAIRPASSKSDATVH